MIKADTIPLYLKLSQIFIGIVLFFYVMYIGQEIIVPFIFSLLISILLNPFVEYLKRKGFNPVLSILLVVLISSILISLLLYFLFSQATTFSDALPQLKVKVGELFGSTSEWVSNTFNISDKKITQWIAKQKGEGISSSPALIGKTIVTVSGVLFTFFLLPVYVFMFLFYKTLLLKFISCLFPNDRNGVVKEILAEVKNLIQSYLYGLSIEAGLVAILNSAVLLIIGVEYAILLGILGAILNVIPYVGGVVAIGLPMIIALATQSPSAALWVLVGYSVVQFIDNQFIVPYVVASKVKINGLISIVVVLIGGSLWGISGMLLSIPLTAVFKVIFDKNESLKPWGILLGDEIPKPVFPRNRKKKVVK